MEKIILNMCLCTKFWTKQVAKIYVPTNCSSDDGAMACGVAISPETSLSELQVGKPITLRFILMVKWYWHAKYAKNSNCHHQTTLDERVVNSLGGECCHSGYSWVLPPLPESDMQVFGFLVLQIFVFFSIEPQTALMLLKLKNVSFELLHLKGYVLLSLWHRHELTPLCCPPFLKACEHLLKKLFRIFFSWKRQILRECDVYFFVDRSVSNPISPLSNFLELFEIYSVDIWL